MIGYACINTELRNKNIYTSRTMRKKTFEEKGLEYVSELSLQNCKDLLTILEWNEQNNIKFFRMSSNIFPWCNEHNFFDLPNVEEIVDVLESIGKFANDYGHRLTFHPDHFCKLAGTCDKIVENTIVELEFHSLIMDLMNLSTSPYNKINIHVGGAYNDKKSTAKRFCRNFLKLSQNLQSRLTVENDDKFNLFSVYELYTMIHKVIDIPIVFDYHHHRFCDDGYSEVEALEMALSTWQNNVKPIVHYSDSRKFEQNDDKIKPQAHSDFIFNYVDNYGHNIDIMFEAKMKEQSVLKYRKRLE